MRVICEPACELNKYYKKINPGKPLFMGFPGFPKWRRWDLKPMFSRKNLYLGTFREWAESPGVTRNRNEINHKL